MQAYGRLELGHVALAPGEAGAGIAAASGERFLYVVRGAGAAIVGDETFALEHESVLWLDPGDAPSLTPGPEGLEVLIARAPL